MQGRQREVMWPGLVANKFLKRPGKNRFIADYPNNAETFIEIPTSQEHALYSKTLKNDREKNKHKVFVSTWNVGGIAPPDDLNLEDWLDTCNNPCDIYVLGFQEIVPLSAGNILGPENSRISMKWNSLIRAALNKTVPTQEKNQEPKIGEKQRIYPLKDGNSREIPLSDFDCIISKQMVGIMVSVWVRGDLRPYIQHRSVSCVGCGIMGCLGNKGSVSVSFCLCGTSFCFVCSHLASGDKAGDEMHRNSNAMEIFSRTRFPHRGRLNLPRKILDHERIILLGDLNYRISLPEAKIRSLVEKREWDILLDNDQLRAELCEGQVFEGWDEGMIEFAPTYKYYPSTDKYFGYVQTNRGEKRRTPAWCDRILWYGKGLKQNHYDRGESRLSDHRPVRAIFDAEVEALGDFKVREGFFFSERFEQISKNFAIFSSDGFRFNNGRSSFQI